MNKDLHKYSDAELLSFYRRTRKPDYLIGLYERYMPLVYGVALKYLKNAIERLMRYISLSRRNSLFCGSHQGAKRAALIYSLACSCRLNNINSFEYFKDLLTKLIDINPNTDHETIRNLLPHKWQR